MMHVNYTKRELAAIIRLGIRAARSNRISYADLLDVMMGVHDALGRRYDRLWTSLDATRSALGLAPNGHPYAADLPDF